MDRSQSILRSLVAATLLTAGLLAASAALAQRAITNSNRGNDPTIERRGGTALVGCDVSNTYTRINGVNAGGNANVCAVTSSGENTAAASGLAAAYGGNPAYTLSLSSNSPDRATANGISSGGLFSLVTGLGDGQGAVELAFQRQQFGDFLIAFSGFYPNNTGLNNQPSPWSAYYLFDDVGVEKYLVGSDDSIQGQMNFELFDRSSRTDPMTGETTNYRDYTAGLVVNQVSIYTLDRTPRVNGVPEAGSLALAGLGLAVLAGLGRRRRGAAA